MLILNVSPYRLGQSSVLMLDRRYKLIESCIRHAVALDVRDAGPLEDGYLAALFSVSGCGRHAPR